ncbi:MAG: Spy/CpxP family protein refolding chaperone [Pirellulales bacterium]
MSVAAKTLFSTLTRTLVRGTVLAALAAGWAAEVTAQQPDAPREQNQPGQGGDRGPGGQGRGFGGRGPGGPGGFGGRGPGGGGGFGGGGGGELMLLANEQVQKELELIDEQIKDFEKIREEQGNKMREMFAGMRDLPEDEHRASSKKCAANWRNRRRRMREQMKGVLMPHQQDRLRELFVQIRGVGALDDPEVSADLKITEDQKKQLADKREEMGAKMREMFSGRRGEGEGERRGPDEDMRAKFQQMQTDMNDQMLSVLSSEQKAQFEKMKGEKFEFDRSQFSFGGRGPGGPGGQGGQGGPGGGGFGGRRPGGDGGRRPEGDRPTNDRPEGDRPQGERPTND